MYEFNSRLGILLHALVHIVRLSFCKAVARTRHARLQASPRRRSASGEAEAGSELPQLARRLRSQTSDVQQAVQQAPQQLQMPSKSQQQLPAHGLLPAPGAVAMHPSVGRGARARVSGFGATVKGGAEAALRTAADKLAAAKRAQLEAAERLTQQARSCLRWSWSGHALCLLSRTEQRGNCLCCSAKTRAAAKRWQAMRRST